MMKMKPIKNSKIHTVSLRKWLKIAITCLAATLLLGCSYIRFPAAFKIDVAQGNILEIEKVEQLQPGMTQRQVLYLLGSPVMKNSLDNQVWYYIYQFSRGGDVPQKYDLNLRFDGEVLQEITGDTSKIKAWHETI